MPVRGERAVPEGTWLLGPDSVRHHVTWSGRDHGSPFLVCNLPLENDGDKMLDVETRGAEAGSGLHISCGWLSPYSIFNLKCKIWDISDRNLDF